VPAKPSVDYEAVHVAGQVSKSIQRLLRETGWSLRKLAREAQISPETVSKLNKASRPDVSVITLLRIQRAMKLTSVETLLAGDEGLPSQRLAEQLSLPMKLPPGQAKKPPKGRRRQKLTP
jgi:transcriptional regulator with XRE-family HTH domain